MILVIVISLLIGLFIEQNKSKWKEQCYTSALQRWIEWHCTTLCRNQLWLYTGWKLQSMTKFTVSNTQIISFLSTNTPPHTQFWKVYLIYISPYYSYLVTKYLIIFPKSENNLINYNTSLWGFFFSVNNIIFVLKFFLPR